MRAGGWQHTIGPGLAGLTLGVVGLGRLGVPVARLAQAFGMSVLAWSPNLTPERAAEHGARAVGKHELFAEADVVTIHMPLSERSRGLVGAAELAAMRPTAYLVNTSRGPIVDEAALIDALRDGGSPAPGLDVYDVEPLPPDHPLRVAAEHAAAAAHRLRHHRQLPALVRAGGRGHRRVGRRHRAAGADVSDDRRRRRHRRGAQRPGRREPARRPRLGRAGARGGRARRRRGVLRRLAASRLRHRLVQLVLPAGRGVADAPRARARAAGACAWLHAPAVLAHAFPDGRVRGAAPRPRRDRRLAGRVRAGRRRRRGCGSCADYERDRRSAAAARRCGPFPPVRSAARLLRTMGAGRRAALRAVRGAAGAPVRRRELRRRGRPDAARRQRPAHRPAAGGRGQRDLRLAAVHARPDRRLPGAGRRVQRHHRRAGSRLAGPAAAGSASGARVDVDRGRGRPGRPACGWPAASGSRPARCWPTSPRPRCTATSSAPSTCRARLVDDLGTFQWDTPTLKVNWALSGPIPWTAPDARGAGTVHLGVDLDGLTHYAADLATGRMPAPPVRAARPDDHRRRVPLAGRHRVGLGLHAPARPAST